MDRLTDKQTDRFAISISCVSIKTNFYILCIYFVFVILCSLIYLSCLYCFLSVVILTIVV